MPRVNHEVIFLLPFDRVKHQWTLLLMVGRVILRGGRHLNDCGFRDVTHPF